jgi:hypothetical protein
MKRRVRWVVAIAILAAVSFLGAGPALRILLPPRITTNSSAALLSAAEFNKQKRKADAGDSDAAVRLFVHFSTLNNFKEAMPYLRKARDLGNQRAKLYYEKWNLPDDEPSHHRQSTPSP